MKKLFLFIILFAYFCVLGVIATAPLIRHMHNGMPFTHAVGTDSAIVEMPEGDYLQLYYSLWLFRDALVGDTPFLQDPYQFKVGKNSLYNFSLQFLPLSLIFALLSWKGTIFAYNLLVILSFPLAGLAMYALCHLLTKSRLAACLGGTIFALAPYRLVHLSGGHPGGFVVFLLPLIVYFFLLAVEKQRGFYAFISGLCYLSLGLLEFHMVYYLSLIFALFVPLVLIYVSRRPGVFPDRICFDKQQWLSLLRAKALLFAYLVVATCGCILGFFVYMVAARRLHSPLLISFIPAGLLLLSIFWMCYAWVLSLCTGRDLKDTLIDDSISYLPLLLLLLYRVQFKFDVPGLGGNLMVSAFSAVIFLKMLYVIKHRHLLVDTTGVHISLRPGALRIMICYLIPAGIYAAWIYYEKTTRLSGSVVDAGRSVGLIKSYSPHWVDFLSRYNVDGEKMLYLGIFSMFLAMMAVAYLFLEKKLLLRQKVVIGFCALLFVMAFSLGFGFSGEGPLQFLYGFFYYHVPFFNFQRVPSRIVYIEFCFLSVLASFGLLLFCQRLAKKWWLATLISLFFVVSVIADYIPSQRTGIALLKQESSVYEYIEKHIGPDQTVLNIPVWPGESSWTSLYLWYITLYPHSMINGYRAAISRDYIANVFEPLERMNVGQIDTDTYQHLKDWHVQFIVVHENAYPGKVSPFPAHFTSRRFQRSVFLDYLMRDESGHVLFGVSPDAGHVVREEPLESPLTHTIQAEQMRSKNGTLVISKSDRSLLYADIDSGRGYLAYDRDCNLPGGVYQASFSVGALGGDDGNVIATLELWDKRKNILINSRNLKMQDFGRPESEGFVLKDFTLDFIVDQFALVEPRILHHGRAKLWFDRVQLLFAQDDEARYEAEDLFTKAHVVQDTDASGGEAVFASKEKDADSDMVYGPYRIFEPSSYQASFWMRLPNNAITNEHDAYVAVVYITSNFGKHVIASTRIKTSDLKAHQTYQPVHLPFDLDQKSVLEFKVRFLKGSDLLVDKIEVERR
ncbi:MAG: hypothetical protein Q8Q33_02205 [Chlamydiota bacterium]|nr:hypothetical protein [Chlamydiota bacterium]